MTKGARYGPYICVQKLGEGGMAETYLALRSGPQGFERRVCIKLIRQAYRDSPEFVDVFFKEAIIAASLRHSNIVGVIDANQQEGYMVLELVSGVDLDRLIRYTPAHRLEYPLTIYLALELAKALDFAHNRRLRGKPDGVVHLDLKPSNVLISYAGEVKLSDFGIAMGISSSRGSEQTIRGTKSYMSPEQAAGGKLDARSDLFSLGILLYEVLAGKRPFQAKQDSDASQADRGWLYNNLADAEPDVPAGLAAVVEKLLRVDPGDRYQSARELIVALDRLAPPPSVYLRLGALAREAHTPETVLPLDGSGLSFAPLRVSELVDETVPPDAGVFARSELSDEPAPLSGSVDGDVSGATVALSRKEPVPAGPNQLTRIAEPRNGSPAPAENRPARSATGGVLPGSRTPLLLGASAMVAVLALAVLANPAGCPSSGATGVKGTLDERMRTAETSTAESSPGSSAKADEWQAANPVDSPPPIVVYPRETDPPEPFARRTDETAGAAAGERGASGPEDLGGDSAKTRASSRPEADSPEGMSAPSGRARSRDTDVGRKPKARISVGVFPWGKVWIDGKAQGEAPLETDLAPGRHVVAAGEDGPTKFRTVFLKPGAKTEVVINLGSETTP